VLPQKRRKESNNNRSKKRKNTKSVGSGANKKDLTGANATRTTSAVMTKNLGKGVKDVKIAHPF